MEWEYKFWYGPLTIEALNDLGGRGWELVMERYPGADSFIMIFKRPKHPSYTEQLYDKLSKELGY